MNVTTAIIFASGFGTRMLPITAAVQKELLPVLNRPVIDYVVDDCVRGGIKRIIFVVRPGTHALQDYYLGSPSLEQHLERFGKAEAIKLLKSVHHQAVFEFIEQPADAGYGTAVPVRVVRPHLGPDEAVVVCGGDDFLFHADGTSEIGNLIKAFQSTDAAGAVTVLERPDSELHRYGVVQTRPSQDSLLLEDLIEKPSPGTAPSNLINIGKYVMTPQMLDYVDQLERDTKSGEYYLTDAVLACAKKYPVVVHPAGGQHLDAGNMAGWIEANRVVGEASQPAIKNA
jgi:UTP--glucose-1-phosphate uridylyltransferase